MVDVSKNLDMAREYGIQATPTILVLDASGTVVDGFVGVPEKSQVEAVVDSVL